MSLNNLPKKENKQSVGQARPVQLIDEPQMMHAEINARSGPLPIPEEMEGYKKVDESFPRRIVEMMEDSQSFSHKTIEKEQELKFRNKDKNRTFSYCTLILGVGASICFAFIGFQYATIASILATLGSPLISLLHGKKDSSSKDDQ